jgi:glycosyltransferase involved in cell wall biosynthesis
MKNVVIASPVATQSGYGHHAREIINNLIKQRGSEWDIKLVSLPWGHTPFTYPLSTDLINRVIPLPIQSQPDIWIQVTIPNEFQPVGKFNIGVTAGTEGDACTPEWIDNLNTMQLIIVPSNFTKQVFENTAKQHNKIITTKMVVVPEYYDSNVYNGKSESDLEILNNIPESFCYLTVGHWLQGSLGEDRKNIAGVIHCFFNTFKNKKDQPALVLKTSGATYSIMDRIEIENKILSICDMFPNDKLPNVYLLHGELTDSEMNLLYNHSKVKAMISFTKAEGFGRPLLEFSTTAKPIIAPHYSGPADFLKKDFICEIKGGLTEIHPSAQNDWIIAGSKWFTPDYGQASALLKDVRDNYKKWQELAKRQRYFVSTTFNETAIAKTYETVLSIVDESVNKIPKAVELKLPQLKKIELPKLNKVGV